MRHKFLNYFLALALVIGVGAIARAQDEEEAVRGSFLTTRVTSSSTSGKSSASATIAATAGQAANQTSSVKSNNSGGRGKTTGGRTKSSSGKSSAGMSAKASTGKSSASVGANVSVKTYSPAAIGLGYSLYMRGPDGYPVRVDPSREFRAGDRIRLSLESNTDGYLYIFHTENDATPQMLYPDKRLGNGENRIQAHVPYEIPWNEPGVDNWFQFDANPASERLYIVVTRQPLPGIPTGAALVKYCGQNRCPWQPQPNDWAQVKFYVQAKVGVVKSTSYGQKQTQAESVAVTRGLNLDQSAPEPSVIRMNASSDAPVLVTTVDLIHR